MEKFKGNPLGNPNGYNPSAVLFNYTKKNIKHTTSKTLTLYLQVIMN